MHTCNVMSLVDINCHANLDSMEHSCLLASMICTHSSYNGTTQPAMYCIRVTLLPTLHACLCKSADNLSHMELSLCNLCSRR